MAKEVWDKLEVTHEGINRVKESKVNILVHKYELFKMEPNEGIKDMFAHFTNIVNELKVLGKTYMNVELVRKILMSLPQLWGPKVIAIKEAKNLNALTLDELLGSLITHEITLKVTEEDPPRRKGIVLKAKVLEESDDESNESNEDITNEEWALMSRKWKKFWKQERRNFQKRIEGNKRPSKKN